MAMPPAQTAGTALQSPFSQQLGYGTALQQQVDDETAMKKKKALQDATAGQNAQQGASMSLGMGYTSGSSSVIGGFGG